jgi:hypothetical protein
MNMQGRLTLLLSGVLVLAAAAQAEGFRNQGQLSYDNINPDAAGASDVDVFALRGTFYFSQVPTDGVPVGEAAYIARSSYAEVIASQADFGDDDVDAWAANLGYHVPNTIFFGRAGVVSTDDDTNWNGTFGIIPIPRLFFGTDFAEGGYDPNLTARYVGKLANDHWYAASVNVVDQDDGDTEGGFEFDYYFPSFKLGGGFNTGGDRWNVRAETGLPHGFALLGRYYTADDGDGFGVTLTWRDL